MIQQLFQHAARELKQAAAREFRRTALGQLATYLENGRQFDLPAARLVRRLSRVAQAGPSELVRAAVGSELGTVVRMVERYKRGGTTADVVNDFLRALGPVGELLGLLVAPLDPRIKPHGQLGRQFAAAIRFLQAFGYEVLPPAERRAREPDRRAAEAARQYLESLGYTVVPPDEMPQKRAALPAGLELRPGRKTVDVPLSTGQTIRLRPDHPMLTGEVVHCESSNVHSFRYDYESATLYVRFLGHRRDGTRGGPGPMYRYSDVEPELFLSLQRAASKGGWVWDHLRIRGTISGHQKDYELVGVSGGYVPRKATMTPMGEAYAPRKVRLPGGQWVQSKRPAACGAPARPARNRSCEAGLRLRGYQDGEKKLDRMTG